MKTLKEMNEKNIAEIERKIAAITANREVTLSSIEKFCEEARKYSFSCTSHNLHSYANELQKYTTQIEVLQNQVDRMKFENEFNKE